MAASKRKRDDNQMADHQHSIGCQTGNDSDGSLATSPDRLAKHRRTASGSDFSTFDIKHALSEPAVLPPPRKRKPAPPPQQAAPCQPATNKELTELLDFSALDTEDAISARFEDIASEILHNYRIEIAAGDKTEQLDVLELEFYLYKSGSHEDPFTHASAEQSQAGRWYFHRPPRRTNEPTAVEVVGQAGYRGGTRKGLDLTIGLPPPAPTGLASKYFPQTQDQDASGASSSTSKVVLRGGVLLRSIRRVSDQKVISGPSLLVDELLSLSGASEIIELVGVNWDGDIAAFPPRAPHSSSQQQHTAAAMTGPRRLSTMWFRRRPDARPASETRTTTDPDDTTAKPRIFRTPRIGLDISHPSIMPADACAHPRVAFIARAYRFLVTPHLLTVNGRGQTFLGVYDALEERGNCADDGELVGELVRLTAVKAPTAEKYLSALRAGLAPGGGGVEEWIGPKGKTVLSSVTSWLKMMGTLRRLKGTAA
ncbi:hypothetical protein C8Q78DRAFT_107514 [Trametes maxima]|nr:hypothetical protein C8Q78DRAFT_107514 [Trametes maxima]